jgi:prepilin-type N-terminal cleavage/methylation domain-containing protein/prepilin-type processing-associated H-X9-DG protein
MNRPLSSRLRRAFTLIELLVVVAIIALLVAILIPALGAAKQRAQVSACAANLTGLAKSAILYTADNSDSFPVRSNTSTAPNVFDAFDASRQLINFDNKNLKIFADPGDSDPSRVYPLGNGSSTPDLPAGTTTSPITGLPTTGSGDSSADAQILGISAIYAPNNPTATARISYGLNTQVTLRTQDDVPSATKTLQYQYPSQTLLYADATWVNARGFKSSTTTPWPASAGSDSYGMDVRYRVIFAGYPDRLAWKTPGAWAAALSDPNTGQFYPYGTGGEQTTPYPTGIDLSAAADNGYANNVTILNTYARHKGGNNIAFLDAHVEQVKSTDIAAYSYSNGVGSAKVLWSRLETPR